MNNNIEQLTVRTYLDDWMKSHVEVIMAPTTVDNYKTSIEKHINPYLGDIKLKELNKKNLECFYSIQRKEGRADGRGGLSNVTIQLIHRTLHSAFRHAVKKNIIEKNPADYVKVPIEKSYSATVYNKQELRHLLNLSKGTSLEIPIILASMLGLRRGEVLGLKWSNVDFDKKTVYIRDNLVYTQKGIHTRLPKGANNERSIHMPQLVCERLKEHRQNQNRLITVSLKYKNMGFVYCKMDGTPYNPTYFSKKFSKFLEQENLKKIRFHDLRHSNAALMHGEGVPAKVIAERLGHSTIAVTFDIYVQTQEGQLIDAAEKIENAINEE